MSRFDPYDAEIRNCFCPLCMALAKAALRGGGAWRTPSNDLYDALVAGAHCHKGPKVSLSKVRCYRGGNQRDFIEGVGLGVTPGGVTGSRRRS